MPLTAFEIWNVKEVPHLRVETGVITTLTGENGVGKSTILDALIDVFRGGSDPGLIRNGAEYCKTRLEVLGGEVYEKTIWPTKYELKGFNPDGSKMEAVKTHLDALAKSLQYDPIKFIYAKAQERFDIVLEQLPIKFSREEIAEAVGDVASDDVPDGPVDLAALDKIRKAVYNRRKDVNVAHRDMEGTIRKLAESLPEGDDETDWSQRVAQLRAEVDSKRGILGEARAQLAQQAEQAKAAARKQADEEINTIRQRLEKEIADLEDEKNRVYSEGAADTRAEIEDLTGQLGAAEERAKATARSQGAKENLENFRQQARQKYLQSEKLSGILDSIDALKESKLQDLPIPGLDIKDGEIYLSGVHWDHVEDSARFLFAIQLSACRPGELGFMIADRAEALDENRWQGLQDAIRNAGLQLAAARREEGPLQVQSDGTLFPVDKTAPDEPESRPRRRRRTK